MTRREILRYTAGLTGAALSTPFISAFLSGCTTKPETDFQPQFFEHGDFDFLGQFLDVLLPKTDSPSAREVGVDQMIDHMYAEVFNPGDQEKSRKSWSLLKTFLTSQSDIQAGFEICESLSDKKPELRKAYNEWKGQSISYYLTTKTIGTEYLNYLPVPGPYLSCIPVEDVNNKKWAE